MDFDPRGALAMMWMAAACGGGTPAVTLAPPKPVVVSPECEAGKQATEEHVRAMTTAVTRWRSVYDGCPDAVKLHDGQALPSLDLGTDGYGHPIEVKCSLESTLVRSAGCDGSIGSADDVSATEPTPARVALVHPHHDDGSPTELAGASTWGAAPVNNADRVIAGLRPGFKSCYSKGLADDPSLSGTLKVVSVTYGKDGKVTDAEVQSTMPPKVVDCVKAFIRKSEQIAPGEGSTITVPINLSM